MGIINPRREVMEKLIVSKFIEKIGKESVFLSVEEAIETCQFSLDVSKSKNELSSVNSSVTSEGA